MTAADDTAKRFSFVRSFVLEISTKPGPSAYSQIGIDQ